MGLFPAFKQFGVRGRTGFEQIIETYKKEILASKACEVRALIQPLWVEETLPE